MLRLINDFTSGSNFAKRKTSSELRKQGETAIFLTIIIVTRFNAYMSAVPLKVKFIFAANYQLQMLIIQPLD